jgi:hypothetical protein
MEWVIEQVTPTGNFLVLTKANYFEWDALMCVMLQARGLWTAVSEGSTDYTEDRMVLEVVTKVVPLETLGSIMSKPSAKAVWALIILRNVGVYWVCKAKASSLKDEFDSISFHDGESVDNFGAHIGQITNQLAVIGFEYQEEDIVHRFLLALPKFE